VVNTDEAQTLSSKTLTTPTIAATGWSSANHAHAAADSGGQIATSNLSGTIAISQGGTTETASAEDAVLVGASTTDWQAKVLPSCSGATTDKLLYNSTTNVFSCGADQGAGAGAGLTRIAGASGAAGADITWQLLTANAADCTTVALCAAAITTTGVGVGTWRFRYTLIYQTAAATTGIGFGVNHTGTATLRAASWVHVTTGGAAATGIGDDVAAVVAGQMAEGKSGATLNAVIGSASAGVITINANHLAVLDGVLNVTVSGSLELKIASEVASSAVRITDESMLELHKIE
jgi:hypothetical protein